MLDYQTAKDLYAEIKAKMAEDPDTPWEEFVVSSIRYVGYITEEHLRDKTKLDKYPEKGEDGLTAQEFLNKTAGSVMDMLKKSVCKQLVWMSRSLVSIKELLPSDESKLEFAWYVAMFEIMGS